jgi:hypothetical protein
MELSVSLEPPNITLRSSTRPALIHLARTPPSNFPPVRHSLSADTGGPSGHATNSCGHSSVGKKTLRSFSLKPPPKSYRVRDTREGLAILGMIADTTIVSRTDHQDAIGVGQGVTEFNKDGQAADEVRRLWAWLENRVRDIPHVKAA